MPKLQFPDIFTPFKNNLGFICQDIIDGNNIKELQTEFKLPSIAWCKQTHEDKIFEANKKSIFSSQADAIICREKSIPLLIRTADCIAILLYDPNTKTIAAIHAGWRSQGMKIVSKTIQKLKSLFQVEAKNLKIWASPSLKKCCSEFSSPQTELPKWMHPFIHMKNKHVDLTSALEFELLENKIEKNNIEISQVCTQCDQASWSSYRRDNSQRRISNIIWLK